MRRGPLTEPFRFCLILLSQRRPLAPTNRSFNFSETRDARPRPKQKRPVKIPRREPRRIPPRLSEDFHDFSGSVPILGTRVVEAAGEPVKVYGPGKVPVELTINGEKHACSSSRASPCWTRSAINWTSPAPSACAIVPSVAPALCSWTTARSMRARFWRSRRRAKRSRPSSLSCKAKPCIPSSRRLSTTMLRNAVFARQGLWSPSRRLSIEHPNASPEEIRRGLSGNLCRCGTYHGIQLAIAQMAQKGA